MLLFVLCAWEFSLPLLTEGSEWESWTYQDSIKSAPFILPKGGG